MATVLDSKDGFLVTGAKSATYGPYVLLGGKYFFTTTAADTTNVLNYLQPDGTTYTAVGSSTSFTTSAGNGVVDLPPCTVQVVLVSASTAVAFALARIPYRAA